MSQLKPSPWKAPQASLPIALLVALLVAAVVTHAAAAPPRDESHVGVTRGVSAYLAGAGLVASVVRHDAIELLGFALFLAVALLSRAESVRLALGLRCPVCNAIKGEPVLGAHALSCRACGSTWSVADP